MNAAGRRLCIAIDDVGLHEGIASAVECLVGLGRAQALACMVGGEAWPQAAALLRRLDPDAVDIGLHLDLSERPLPAEAARSLPMLVVASHLHALGRRGLRMQIHAQLDAFEQALGRSPDFVDGHQHVHQLPTVRRELLDELARRSSATRPWLRRTTAPSGSRLKARLISALGSNALRSLARERGFGQNRHLLGVYDFRGGASRYREMLHRWLRAATDGDLLMCHPSAAFAGPDSIIAARVAEFAVFSGDAFAEMLDEQQMQLQPMSRILRSARAASPIAAPCGR